MMKQTPKVLIAIKGLEQIIKEENRTNRQCTSVLRYLFKKES
jgi:hypothetical protein